MKTFCYAVTLLMILACCLGGCAMQEKQKGPGQAQTKNKTAGPLKGITVTPKSFAPDDFSDFLQKSRLTGRLVSWNGDWDDLDISQKGGPVVIAELAGSNGYIPLIEAQFFSPSTGHLLRPLDETVRQRYKNYIVAFAEKYKPEYLALGIELNTLYEKAPEQFDEFVRFYPEVYSAVKAKSKNTKIFPVFQLERMKGLFGGLFGGINDEKQAEWYLIDRFSDADLVGFTSYPSLIYKDPAEIPADYYSEIRIRTTKPVAFTEIGWHSGAGPSGWESSGAEQAAFITAFFFRTQGMNPEFVIWSFLYDQDVPAPFSSMGLRNRDDSAKPAWDRWVNA
jgi:hypothetical protein